MADRKVGFGHPSQDRRGEVPWEGHLYDDPQLDPFHRVVYPSHRDAYLLDHPSLHRRGGRRVCHHPYSCEADHPVYPCLDRGDRRVDDFSCRGDLCSYRGRRLGGGPDLGHRDETILLVLVPAVCLQASRLDRFFEADC